MSLQAARLKYQPRVPPLLRDLRQVGVEPMPRRSLPAVAALFPHTCATSGSRAVLGNNPASTRALKIGAIFSGGPAPGGHNVLTGLFDALQQINPASQLIGFLDGPAGLLKNRSKVLDRSLIDSVRNQGGFDLIGSGRDKIETAEQFALAAKHVIEHALDALVIIGGDDSNTNAALLAEAFLAQRIPTRVIGVPKTIDGDLRSEEIELPFGFDSACKTYAELVGNIARDALSSKKYYHFIKLMGRSASHITLECALATHPNLALIGEERYSLQAVVDQLVRLVVQRAERGKTYGVILIPEGLIEFFPQGSLPQDVQAQLGQKDAHGNPQLSHVATEKLLIELVKKGLAAKGYNGSFTPLEHFFGYEGRCCFPTNFDADYTYSLGRAAALAAREQLTGVIVAIQSLRQPPENWGVAFVPIVQLMHLEERGGKRKPVIRKALVDLGSSAFLEFARERKKWELDDCYQYPGPIQFFGEFCT